MSTLTRQEPVAAVQRRSVDSLAQLLETRTTARGHNLAALSLVSPILLVFLRHSGCTFCREALSDLKQTREAIEQFGARIVVVHLGEVEPMLQVLRHYGLEDLDRISDDDQELYRSFGLRQGSWWQLASPRVWWRGLKAAWWDGHGVGKPTGDVRQMPGMFLLDRCEVARSFRHSSAADRPLYEAFVRSSLKRTQTGKQS
ncbi:MAG: redoxin domain-containing protein [Bryobacterales bacterium]|nr:redoxin domain-containing protein [Bryobacterales bacterium]